MQFDGLDDEIYSALRGKPLLKEKLEAIKICGENGIGVTLVPTVVPNVNDHQIGMIINFGMKNSPVVRGVHFQPISYFGRYPEPPKDENRITLPEIVAAIEHQTERLIRQTSASSDCCCKTAAERAGNRKSDEEALRNRNFVARRWKRNLSLEKEAADDAGAADAADIPDFDTFLARVAANGFTVTGMAFQDAYNLDMERLRRCSLHVYDNGRIVPFCAKYLTGI